MSAIEMEIPLSTQQRFVIETWILYSTGVLVILLRVLTSFFRKRSLQLARDDYLMLIAIVPYTVLCVSLNEIMCGGGSNFIKPDWIMDLTSETIADKITGSKWVIVSEQAFIVSIWLTKGCMLLVYDRILSGIKKRQYVTWLAGYIGVGFVVAELTFFLACRPFHDYWAVPAPADKVQCSTYEYFLIIQGVFNISSDIMMLALGASLVNAVQVPRKQKLGLIMVFGMGIFVIAAAIVNKVYNLDPALSSIDYTFWYMREVTVAIYVTNLPPIWPGIRYVYHRIRSVLPGAKKTPVNRSQYTMSIGSQATRKPGAMSSSSQETLVGVERSDTLEKGLEIKQDISYTIESNSRESIFWLDKTDSLPDAEDLRYRAEISSGPN